MAFLWSLSLSSRWGAFIWEKSFLAISSSISAYNSNKWILSCIPIELINCFLVGLLSGSLEVLFLTAGLSCFFWLWLRCKPGKWLIIAFMVLGRMWVMWVVVVSSCSKYLVCWLGVILWDGNPTFFEYNASKIGGDELPGAKKRRPRKRRYWWLMPMGKSAKLRMKPIVILSVLFLSWLLWLVLANQNFESLLSLIKNEELFWGMSLNK